MQHAVIAQHHSVMLLLTVPFVQMCEVLEAKTTTSVGEFSILSNFEVHHSIGDIGVDAMRQLSSLFNHYLNSRFEKNWKELPPPWTVQPSSSLAGWASQTATKLWKTSLETWATSILGVDVKAGGGMGGMGLTVGTFGLRNSGTPEAMQRVWCKTT